MRGTAFWRSCFCFARSVGPLLSSKPSSWGPSGPVSCLRPLLVDLGVAKAPLQMPKCMVLYCKTIDSARSPVRPKVAPRALKGAPLTPRGVKRPPLAPQEGPPGCLGGALGEKAAPSTLLTFFRGF